MNKYQELFNHMANEHCLTLLEGELQEIVNICKKTEIEDPSNDMMEPTMVWVNQVNRYYMNFQNGALTSTTDVHAAVKFENKQELNRVVTVLMNDGYLVQTHKYLIPKSTNNTFKT